MVFVKENFAKRTTDENLVNFLDMIKRVYNRGFNQEDQVGDTWYQF